MADATLVLAALVLAHLVADFLLQTGRMVADKGSSGRRAVRGLLLHGAGVAVCLVPIGLAFGAPGWYALIASTLTHVAIDRWKVLATRRAEARALAGAHARHEETASEADSLGPAWTPMPGALFAADQLLHAIVLAVVWAIWLNGAAPVADAAAVVDRLLGDLDRTAVHRAALLTVVVASLAIVNVRAGALFVATLVRPREAVTGAPPAPESSDASVAAASARQPVAWRLRIGRFVAHAEPVEVPASVGRAAAEPPATHASPVRVGATIGVLERLLIVTFVLTNATVAIGFVVGAKTLARFKQLDDRDFAEYYLLGTLASVGVALGSALLAQAALGTAGF